MNFNVMQFFFRVQFILILDESSWCEDLFYINLEN